MTPSQPRTSLDLPPQSLKDAPPFGFGERGEHVRELQKALAGLGFFPHTPHKTFGPRTRDAVGKFQLTHGIVRKPDEKGYGYFGPKTKAKLLGILAVPTKKPFLFPQLAFARSGIVRKLLNFTLGLTAGTAAVGGSYLATREDTTAIPFPHEGKDFSLEDLTLKEKLAQIYHGSSYDSLMGSRVDNALNHRHITSRPGLINFTDWLTDWLKSNETIGGVHLFRSDARSLDEVRRTSVELMAKSKIPPLISMDIIGGYTRHLGITQKDAVEYGVPAEFLSLTKHDKNLVLPTQESLGTAFNALKQKKDHAGQLRFRKLMEDYGAAIGRICKDIGVVVNFAPVLDMVKDVNGTQFMEKNDETYGSDLHTIMVLGFHFMKGFQTLDGVMIAPKHFVGTGKMPTNPHDEEGLGVSGMGGNDGSILPFQDAIRGRLFHHQISPVYTEDRTMRTLRNEGDAEAITFTTMPPVGGMMVSHTQSFLNPKTPGTLSPAIIRDKLRNALGFTGIAWTDDMQMGGVTSHGNTLSSERYAGALGAGATMPMVLHSTGSLDDMAERVQLAIDTKEDLDKDGKPDITLEGIDARARLVLDTKAKLGLLSSKNVAGHLVYTNTARAYLSKTGALRK